jgi:hypothetical protein
LECASGDGRKRTVAAFRDWLCPIVAPYVAISPVSFMLPTAT